MNNKKCIGCSQYKNCKDSFASWVFFIIGIIATVALRVVTVLMDFRPIYGKIAWYVGVAGFLVFFIYKFILNQRLENFIYKSGLADKINRQVGLSRQDYKLIGEIFCGLTSKKERINYLFIFVLSAVALILAIYVDFIR